MKIRVTVMLKEGVLDPQGKAIGHALGSLGYQGIGDVRVGKTIELDVSAKTSNEAHTEGEAMARDLLANQVIENYFVEVLG